MSLSLLLCSFFFFFSSRRRHTRCSRDWSSDVCSSDLNGPAGGGRRRPAEGIAGWGPSRSRSGPDGEAARVGPAPGALHAAAGRIDRGPPAGVSALRRSEEHTSELQSRLHLVCRLLLEKKK